MFHMEAHTLPSFENLWATLNNDHNKYPREYFKFYSNSFIISVQTNVPI